MIAKTAIKILQQQKIKRIRPTRQNNLWTVKISYAGDGRIELPTSVLETEVMPLN